MNEASNFAILFLLKKEG